MVRGSCAVNEWHEWVKRKVLRAKTLIFAGLRYLVYFAVFAMLCLHVYLVYPCSLCKSKREVRGKLAESENCMSPDSYI
jgi:hypothetical protein